MKKEILLLRESEFSFWALNLINKIIYRLIERNPENNFIRV